MGFVIVLALKVAQNNNSGFGAMRFTILIGLENKGAHGRYGFWYDVLSSEIEILFLAYLLINGVLL